jgi:glycosyltransferase involved in cell wall biosynthesis
MAVTLWIDVEDLINYARVFGRPSGIQRVSFEISRALHALCGDDGAVRFVRHDPVRETFRIVDWPDIERTVIRLTSTESPQTKRAWEGAALSPETRLFVRKLVSRLPEAPRLRLIDVMVTQERALFAWGRLIGAAVGGIIGLPRRLVRRGDRAKARAEACHPAKVRSGAKFADQVAQGDMLLTLGAPWSHPDYIALIEKHQRRLGLRYALLVYDIIPLRRPEWCDHGLVRGFRAFFDAAIPLCDTVLAISKATAADVTAYAREQGICLSGPVVPIPMGSSFGGSPFSTVVPRTGVVRRSERLPPAGSYVLFVSTIEARKNHLLMFRVWRRLLDELPPDAVPTLVFAGRVGWLVDDLMRQIANAGYLDGKLVVVEAPTDTELVALYQGCQFTVFPSLYEGWGLPVTESLGFGKPCLIADRTSLPEAGGNLARCFDPDNLNSAFAAVRELISDPRGLAIWEERIRREFRRVPWTTTAEVLLSALGYQVAVAERDAWSDMLPAKSRPIEAVTEEAKR